MGTVVLVGTLDTKGEEYDYLRQRVEAAGADALLVDVGVYEPVGATAADVGRQEVARAAGEDIGALAAAGDRGAAVTTMARGAAAVLARLLAEGRLDAVLAVGGSGGTSIAAAAVRDLPVGTPKLIVSTVASGDTRSYMGASDVSMTYSVVDIAGINRVSAVVLGNAAAAAAGMANAPEAPVAGNAPLVGATMFGVTTACVTQARGLLEADGYEVLVFHATGTGGRSLEALARDGFLAGVLDITTTELADELAGGVFSAGPDRLETVGRLGIPQVVSVGALDMVNFGPRETVPERYRDRNLYVHNPTVTLMRTTPDECRTLGRQVAEKLSAARGPTALFLPLRGVSAIAVDGGVFHDPAADDALFSSIREHAGDGVELVELDVDVNDPTFAAAMTERLHTMIQEAQ